MQHRRVDLRLLRPQLHKNAAEQRGEANQVKQHQDLMRDLHGPTLMAGRLDEPQAGSRAAVLRRKGADTPFVGERRRSRRVLSAIRAERSGAIQHS